MSVVTPWSSLKQRVTLNICRLTGHRHGTTPFSRTDGSNSKTGSPAPLTPVTPIDRWWLPLRDLATGWRRVEHERVRNASQLRTSSFAVKEEGWCPHPSAFEAGDLGALETTAARRDVAPTR